MRARKAVSVGTLVLLPALISLVVTLLRLSGELLGWSDTWFSKETGGSVPSGVSWVVGITWLALPFGAYFAWRLVSQGDSPARPVRALLLALAALVLFYAAPRLLVPVFRVLGFPLYLIPIWTIGVIAAAIAWAGWPALGRAMAAYGLLARIPVAIVMALAMLGNWGTHYDYVGMPPQFQMPFWPRYLWLAFFPQLVFWVGYTVVIGMAAGSIVALAMRRGSLAGIAARLTPD